MADPVIVITPKDVWTKVATDVVSGQILQLSEQPQGYFYTHRLTGTSAPSATTNKNESVEIFRGSSNSETIENSVGIDIYIMCTVADGKVRVDL